MLTSQQAITELKKGNQRFIENRTLRHCFKPEPVKPQNPFAIVLGCSDSRAPVEMIFNQGIGQLFVIRVAGNILTPAQLGSIEFAASQFGCPLVLVMGHSDCGAVKLTLDYLQSDNKPDSNNLLSIVECLSPGIQALAESSFDSTAEKLLEASIHKNIECSVKQLQDSIVLKKRVAAGNLAIVGAHYDLASGKVDFMPE